jgi:hypothetical protein
MKTLASYHKVRKCFQFSRFFSLDFTYAFHYEKMGSLITSLAIGFLNCNDHLQLIAIQHIYMGVLLDKLHELQWMQLTIHVKSHTYAT